MESSVTFRDRDPEDETTFDFNELPLHIINLIFEYLETLEIVKMRRVSPAFKVYVDELPKTESSIRPYDMFIINNTFTYYYLSSPEYNPSRSLRKHYRIYEDVQLNWIQPHLVYYGKSNILESSPTFQGLLRNVKDFVVYSIAKGENCMENFCKNLQFIEEIVKFRCFDVTLTEEELAKIISSLNIPSQFFQLTLDQHLPFLTEPIIDSFFKISRGKSTILYIRSTKTSGRKFRGTEEMWRDGIFRFVDFKYEEEEVGDNISKILVFKNCERKTGEAIIAALQQKSNYQARVMKWRRYAAIFFGKRCVQCHHMN